MAEQGLMGAVRRRRSGAEGARLVAEFERSGLGRKEFCAAHGLSVPTQDAWRRRVASSASEEPMVPGQAREKWKEVRSQKKEKEKKKTT